MATKTLRVLADVPPPAEERINAPLMIALAHCRSRGWRSWQVADACGITASAMSLYLHGHRQPTLEVAGRIAAVLGETTDTLWPDLVRNEVTAAGAGDRDGKAGRAGVHESG